MDIHLDSSNEFLWVIFQLYFAWLGQMSVVNCSVSLGVLSTISIEVTLVEFTLLIGDSSTLIMSMYCFSSQYRPYCYRCSCFSFKFCV